MFNNDNINNDNSIKELNKKNSYLIAVQVQKQLKWI